MAGMLKSEFVRCPSATWGSFIVYMVLFIATSVIAYGDTTSNGKAASITMVVGFVGSLLYFGWNIWVLVNFISRDPACQRVGFKDDNSWRWPTPWPKRK